MPWKVGTKTKKGWPIKRQNDSKRWVVVGYSDSLKKAQTSVGARYMATGNKYRE